MIDERVKALVAKLETGSPRECQRAVTELKNRQAVSALIQLLEDKDEDFKARWDVIKTLGAIGDRQAVPVLIQVLSDRDSSMQWRAAEALGEIGDPKAVPALSVVLSGTGRDRIEYRYALKALVKLGDTQAIALALVKSDSSAFLALIEFLADENIDFSVRREVVKALGMLSHPQAVPALIEALKNKGMSIEVRYGAAQALMLLKDPQVVLSLIEALKDERIGQGLGIGWLACSEAVEVSAQVGLPAVPVLIAALGSEDKALRRSAAKALTQITQRHSGPVLRTALPALRRLRGRDPAFREAWEQIEAVTGAVKDLPLPAAAPPLDADTLPRPATVPLEALMTPPQGWWMRLRRRLRSS